jgi:zinc-dependent peptidase
MHWYISLTDFTLDELKRLSILPELLGKLPTKRHDSLSLFQAIKRDIGKLTFQLRVMSRCAEMATPVLDVSCSVLDANVDKAAALVREILTETCFDDRARVQTLILQLSEMAKQKVISDGHRMAMYAASATMSAASAAREALNGLSACMVQKALAENFDAQYPDFLALCERFSKDSAVQSRVTFSLSTNKALDPAAILSAYPVGMPIPDAAPYVSDLPAKCAYRIPSQISFASLGYDYRRAGKVYSGIARVMSNILSLSYLWNEVRVQGGAYGAGLNTSETGRMVTYSYRDPSPARTLGINRSMSKGLRDFVAGDERIDKYIISTVGESEPPLGSENQILVSDENLLCGITPEDLCRERAEMLSTTKDALLTWCGVLDQMAKDGGVCVIGHDGAIAACEKEDLTVL